MKNNKSSAGKGDKRRPFVYKIYSDNYNEINWHNKKDKSLIPKGDYCYTWIEEPNKTNNFHGKTKNCCYFKYKEINGVKVPWCEFLECGGTNNNWTHEEWEKIRKYYGSVENMDKNLPLFLLFDGCKECGVNEWEEKDIEF